MASASSFTIQSLGEIVLRAPAVVRKRSVPYVFVLSCSESMALCARGDIFEQALCHSLCVDFHSVFTVFFSKELPFQMC